MERNAKTMVRPAFQRFQNKQIETSLQVVDFVADAIGRLSSYQHYRSTALMATSG